MLAQDHEILAALAKGRVPAEDSLREDVSPEWLELLRQLRDAQRLALALGRGDLTPPEAISSRGPLVGSLKALHAALRHLSWQAQRVAAGDLSHRVDFMGEFADAFNSMVSQLAERQRLEQQLRQSQKLEAIGRLSTGLAHEINTPAQYVSADALFLGETCTTLLELLGEYKHALDGDEPLDADTPERLAEATAAADLDYLQDEVPGAMRSALEGVERIVKIVAAMKEFASPDHSGRTDVDLNRALQATLTVAEGRCRDVAEVETDFGEIPFVNCRAAEINEAFLNLIVNAVDAIEDAGRKGAGRITISTRAEERGVRVKITDNGCGIPEATAGKIFDPFFTTKEVGRGSGQGLSTARATLVDGHGGTLSYESRPDEGSTFVVWLPAASADEPLAED